MLGSRETYSIRVGIRNKRSEACNEFQHKLAESYYMNMYYFYMNMNTNMVPDAWDIALI